MQMISLSARRYVLVLTPYKNYVYTLVPGVNSQMGNGSCNKIGSLLCWVSNITWLTSDYPFWRMDDGRMVRTLDTAVSGRIVSDTMWSAVRYWYPGVKQFVDEWNSPYSTGPRVSLSIYIRIIIFCTISGPLILLFISYNSNHSKHLHLMEE